MNKNIIILFILTFIIFLCIFVYIENYENIDVDIGNHICRYFYHYSLSILEKKDFNNPIISNANFIKYLPDKIPYDPILYNKFISAKLTYDIVKNMPEFSMWYVIDKNILSLWTILKPTIHNILDNAFIKSNLKKIVKNPVIHFRCSDVPFIQSRDYFLQKYEFFKIALSKINKSVPNKNIILLSCTSHKSNNTNSITCNNYANHIKEYIEKLDYNVNTICNTNLDDFATLFYAPAVISTSGSYSFMSGFFGNGIFISTEHCLNGTTGCCADCEDYDKYFIRGFNISHDKIKDYYNTKEVIQLLQNT
jgi:hypothetical protein